MNGVSNKSKTGWWIGGWEVAGAVAGLTVFIGLAFEDGPEILHSIITHTRPPRAVFGNALVAFGVFAEVAIGIGIARSSRKQDRESNQRIAASEENALKLQEAVANARKRQADAERALVELRLANVPRSTVFPWRAFCAVLESNPKGTVEILYPPDNGEAYELAGVIIRCFIITGWKIPADISPIPRDPTGMVPGIALAGGRPIGITLLGNGNDGGSFSAVVDAFKKVAELRGKQYQPFVSASNTRGSDESVRVIIGPKS